MKLSDIQKLKEAIPAYSRETVREQIASLGLDPENLYQELEMSSRFVDTHRDISYADTPLQLHSHTFYEILYCCNSVGVEYLVGADRYKLEKGDVIVVPPGISHRPLLPDNLEEPYKRYVLWISQEFAATLQTMLALESPSLPRDAYFLRCSGTQQDALHALFRAGVRETEKKQPHWEAAVLGNTVQLAVQLHRCVLEKTTSPLKSEKPELLDKVLAYIETHLSEKILLSDVAKHFFVSESTITQTFRKRLGESFYHCVTQRRLIAAKSMIQQGEQLEGISHKVGFADYSTFYRAFKKEYGISPNQFRKIVGTEDI